MSLRAELVDLELRFPRIGTARWRAERQADEIMALLYRRRFLPPDTIPPAEGSLTVKEYARLPAPDRQAVADHLYRHRIGYWEWSHIMFGPTVWRVCCRQQAPDGGPLWGMVDGEAGPLTYWREIPA